MPNKKENKRKEHENECTKKKKTLCLGEKAKMKTGKKNEEEKKRRDYVKLQEGKIQP